MFIDELFQDNIRIQIVSYVMFRYKHYANITIQRTEAIKVVRVVVET